MNQQQQQMLSNRVAQFQQQQPQRTQQELMYNPLNGNQPEYAPGESGIGRMEQAQFNPDRYQYNPNMQKPYMPQRQMTPEQQRMRDMAVSYGGGGYGQQQQPRAMTMDMPQRYGQQPQLPQYGQSGQQYFSPQQMRQDPYMNYVRNQQQAMQQQSMRSSQQQQYRMAQEQQQRAYQQQMAQQRQQARQQTYVPSTPPSALWDGWSGS
jgi:hypothetical protein